MSTNQLREEGFVILRNVFNESQLTPLRELVDELVAYSSEELFDPFVNYYMEHRVDQGALYDIYQRHPEFRFMAEHERILDALEEGLGEDIYIYENSLLYKPKGKKNAVPWHQDFISRRLEPHKYIVWMALDDARKENGCLKVIPRSHKLGFLSWHRVEGETHHDRVNSEHVDETKVQYVELNAGDVIIFDMLLLHSSDEVHSDMPRRAFRLSYQGFQQIYTPRATPIVVRGGRPSSLQKKFNFPNNIFQEMTRGIPIPSNKMINLEILKFLSTNKNSNLAIFGASESGEATLKLIENFNRLMGARINVTHFIDNNGKLENEFFSGLKVIKASDIVNINIDKIIISSSAYNQIAAQLVDQGFDQRNFISAFH